MLSTLLPATAAAPRPRALTLYVFDRAGGALFTADYNRSRPVADGAGTPDDDRKSMFGLLFSLRSLAAAVDPKR
jgi:hypothetical protein